MGARVGEESPVAGAMKRHAQYGVTEDGGSSAGVGAARGSVADERLAFFVFFLCGTAGMIGWNGVVNMLPTVLTDIYGADSAEWSFSDVMTAVYFTTTCVTTLVTAKILVRSAHVTAGLVLMCVATIVPPAVCASGIAYARVARLMIAYGVLLGVAGGLICACAIAVAARIRGVAVGGVAAGMGFSGMYTLFWWVVLRRVALRHAPLTAIWSAGALSCALSVAALGSYAYLMHSGLFARLSLEPAASAEAGADASGSASDGATSPATTLSPASHVPSARHSLDPESIDAVVIAATAAATPEVPLAALKTSSLDPVEEAALSGSEKNSVSLMAVLRVIWFNLSLRVLVFAGTLSVWPNISPFGWAATSFVADICAGTYQVVDFVGRYIPNFVRPLQTTEPGVGLWVVLRFPLLAVMTLSMVYRHRVDSLWTNPVFRVALMALLSFTNGWLSTALTLQLPKPFATAAEKAKGSAAGMAAGFLGIVIGQWASKLIKALVL